MEANLIKLENITELKMKKSKRDISDYRNNEVYTWNRSNMSNMQPRPILKRDMRSQSYRSESTSPRVGFSEASSDTSQVSASEDFQDFSDANSGEGSYNDYAMRGTSPTSSKNQYYTKPPKNWGRRKRGRKRKRHTRRGRKTISPETEIGGHTPVINLSATILTQPEVNLLAKGLNYCPTNEFNLYNTLLDVKKTFLSVRYSY